MKTQEYNNRFAQTLQYMMGLTQKKGQDYAGLDDPFKNFRLVEVMTEGRISTAAGILVRLSDKLQRIANLLARPAAVQDEKIEDTLIDNAVYSVILYLWLTREKAELGLLEVPVEAPEKMQTPLPEGYQELPADVNTNTIDETYDALAKKVLEGKINELTPGERSYLELVTKMKMAANTAQEGA